MVRKIRNMNNQNELTLAFFEQPGLQDLNLLEKLNLYEFINWLTKEDLQEIYGQKRDIQTVSEYVEAKWNNEYNRDIKKWFTNLSGDSLARLKKLIKKNI